MSHGKNDHNKANIDITGLMVRRHDSLNMASRTVQVQQQAHAAWQFLGQYSCEAARLHLALFYVYGSYYEWPKRLAGQ